MCNQQGAVLDRPGAQQRVPMRLASGAGEGRRHEQQLRASGGIAAKQVRDAQVVANSQTAHQAADHAQNEGLHGFHIQHVFDNGQRQVAVAERRC